MKISIIASTKYGHVMSKSEALDFSGKSAGICYLSDDPLKLFSEDKEKTDRRIKLTLNSGHHSVYGHPTYNLLLDGVPKILVMILNNEKIYNTSERSARYTRIKDDSEKELYDKWITIFKDVILEKYPKMDEKKVLKLAQENARYLVSIFSPYINLEYTVSFQQLNYLISWFEDYVESEVNTPFTSKIKKVMKEFLSVMPDLRVEGLNPRMKGTKLSLFASRERGEEFGENYSVNYKASFAELAQAQRHRTLSYEMSILDNPEFVVPDIIKGTPLEKEWLEDISLLKCDYPQGMLVYVNERGTIENFIRKCQERLCGAAQLEIMKETENTLKKYMTSVQDKKELYKYLEPYSHGARCTFPNWKCNSPCVFGGKSAMKRKI